MKKLLLKLFRICIGIAFTLIIILSLHKKEWKKKEYIAIAVNPYRNDTIKLSFVGIYNNFYCYCGKGDKISLTRQQAVFGESFEYQGIKYKCNQDWFYFILVIFIVFFFFMAIFFAFNFYESS